jgi:hypothetical protein
LRRRKMDDKINLETREGKMQWLYEVLDRALDRVIIHQHIVRKYLRKKAIEHKYDENMKQINESLKTLDSTLQILRLAQKGLPTLIK